MGCFSPPQARLVNKMLSRLWTYIVIQREYFLLTESMNTMMYCYYIQNYCTFEYYGLIIFFNLNCWKEEGDVKEESLKLLLQKAPAKKQRMARQQGGNLLCNKIHPFDQDECHIYSTPDLLAQSSLVGETPLYAT